MTLTYFNRLPFTKYQEQTMPNNDLSYQVQDVPPFIQEILMKYGEKTPIGSEEFIRSFNEVVLKNGFQNLPSDVISEVIDNNYGRYKNGKLLQKKWNLRN